MGAEIVIKVAVVLVVVWLLVALLKAVFRLARALVGWIGVWLVSSIPGVITYFVTQSFFGYGTTDATKQGLITAALIGVIGSSISST